MIWYKNKTIKPALGVLLVLMLIFSACQRENIQQNGNILPGKFEINIPQSINSNTDEKIYSQGDTVLGPRLYRHLRRFIHTGQFGANVVEKIIQKIRKYNLGQDISFSYTSDQDGRVKNVIIVSNQKFEGRTWQYKMTITDAQNAEENDRGLAMEIFWNRHPVSGIAIIKFKNLNANTAEKFENTMLRLEYSEDPATTNGYDETMQVMISDWPLDSTDRYSLKNLMMFVGRAGSRVDVYGNSDHPNAWLLLPDQKGLDWAFAASADEREDIAVADVGLPPNTLNTTQRSVILGQYSLKNVLSNEVKRWFRAMFHFTPAPTVLSRYLRNADSPGMFNRNGFVQGGGTPPSDAYKPLIKAINELTPFNPYKVAHLHISFSSDDADD